MKIKNIQRFRLQLLKAQMKLATPISEISNLANEIEKAKTNGTLTKILQEQYETEKQFLHSMLHAVQKMHKYLDYQEEKLINNN